jgi:type VI secretion system secreted protein VgrG
MSQATQKSRFASFESKLGEDQLLLSSFHGREQLGALFAYNVDLLHPDGGQDVILDELVGDNASIRLQMETDEMKDTRYFNAIIASLTFTGREDAFGTYRARLVPWLWLLTRTSDCRSFQDKTVQQIMEKVFTDYGFKDSKDFRFDLRGSYKPKPFCVQYNETAFNFVSRLMEHEGIYYWWEHSNGHHTMVITDDMVSHTFNPLRKEIESRSGRSVKGGYLYNLQVQKNVSSGAFALNDYNFKSPKEDLRSRMTQEKQQAASHFEHFEYPGFYRDAEEGATLSKIRLQEVQANHHWICANSTARAMAAGYKFQLTRADREDLERNYLIVSSTIAVEVNDYKTGSGSAPKFECQIRGIPDDGVFRSPRLTPKPAVRGPQPALVVGPPGEEIYCDENGRVKVHFYWDRRSEANAESSKWVRVSQPSAGGQYGFMSVPRIGQEVLVEFMNGDPDQPIVTGRVYNGENQHPYDPQSFKSKSSWKTNTYPGGGGFNEVRLDDAKGKEQIFLHGQKDMDTRILNESREFVGVNKHVTTGKDIREQAGQDKHETVLRDSKAHVKEDQSITIDGNDVKRVGKAFEIQSTGTMRIYTMSEGRLHAVGDLGVESEENLVVLGGSSVTLRCGDSFVQLTPAGITIQGPNVWINSDRPSPRPLVPINPLPVALPLAPDMAADASAGRVETSKGMGYQLTADSVSSQKVSKFELAADSGAPFVEIPESEGAPPASRSAAGGPSAFGGGGPNVETPEGAE